MRNKIILLVEASVRALIESAVEFGYRATGIDFYGDADSYLKGEIQTYEEGQLRYRILNAQ